MKTKPLSSSCHNFYYAHLDTLLRVEKTDDQVVIRATSNRFSPERKLAFIRWLAAEGFISEAHRWSSLAGESSPLGVRWVRDLSWVRLDPAMLAQTDRFMYRLLGGVALFWILLMAVVMLK